MTFDVPAIRYVTNSNCSLSTRKISTMKNIRQSIRVSAMFGAMALLLLSAPPAGAAPSAFGNVLPAAKASVVQSDHSLAKARSGQRLLKPSSKPGPKAPAKPKSPLKFNANKHYHPPAAERSGVQKVSPGAQAERESPGQNATRSTQSSGNRSRTSSSCDACQDSCDRYGESQSKYASCLRSCARRGCQ